MGSQSLLLRRLVSRVGFLLFPASVLFIKYYGDLGRGYDPAAEPMNTGVTTNKNILGVMVLVISLGTLWHVITLLRAKGQPNRRRHLLAQIMLLAFGDRAFADGRLGDQYRMLYPRRRAHPRDRSACDQKPACPSAHALSGNRFCRRAHNALRGRICCDECAGQEVESYWTNGNLGGSDSRGAQPDRRRWIRELLDQPLLYRNFGAGSWAGGTLKVSTKRTMAT